ncbi:MAG: shikimate dehydrogenase [Humidesulfovibrio sp.]|nr:shikimate dehydrogenase [Humidesulfovibrio sp.]
MQPNANKKPQGQYGIIGWPLGHSKSPLLHNWGLKQSGLPGAYVPWPTQPAKLKAFVAEVRARHIKGVSVTIPHKQAVMPFLDGLTDRAKAVGAVNTLFWREGKLLGDNTDVEGLVKPLEAHRGALKSALVLGAGGAARAACAALKELGVADIAVANRTASKVEKLAADFGVRAVPWEERVGTWSLVLNTTPLGMLGENQDQSPWPADAFGGVSLVFDLVYNPVRTRFMADAQAAGVACLSGLSMFLHQGLAQFEIWTGVRLDEGRARQVLMADMILTGG